MAAIIEKVTGKTYEKVLSERILIPLNMQNSGFIHYDTTTTKMTTSYQKNLDEKRLHFFNFPCNGASSIYSTVEDLYLWNQGLIAHKLLSPEYTSLMLKPQVPEEPPFYAYWGYYAKYPFGDNEREMYAQTGGGRNIICGIPEDDHFVIILNNIQCPKLDEICVEVFKILYGVEE